MRDRPDRAQMLAIARATLTTELLPNVAADRRMAALMVARAIEIVEREIVAGDAAWHEFAAGLAAIYEAIAPAGDRERNDLVRRLVGDLRADALTKDTERRGAVYRLLLAEARARVALSNPRYLEAEENDRLTSR